MQIENIGVIGGGSIFGIGTQEEMVIFFDAIQKYSEIYDQDTDYSVIIDRLYKRYLRLEDLQKATTRLNKIRDIFAKITIPQEYIDFAIKNEDTTSFVVSSSNLCDFFAMYISRIQKAIDRAIYNHEYYKKQNSYSYQRVMICHTNVIPCTIASRRPNELYDKLEGDPYWMREAVMDWDPKDYPRK